MKVSDLFTVMYGTQLNYKLMQQAKGGDPESVRFVSRSSKNLGVVGSVKALKGVAPFPAGAITVSLGGSYLLSAFVQPHPFYTAQNIAVLTPKKPMSDSVKIFYCICIAKNRFKYSAFGREANRTLKSLELPQHLPNWTAKARASIEDMSQALGKPRELSERETRWYKYTELFAIEKGERIVNAEMEEGPTPCIRPIEFNNGVSDYISIPANHKGNTITVSYNGSVGEAFYQPEPFFALDDINVLYPLFEMNTFIAMFIVPLIRMERYRFSYGRKWNVKRMEESRIRLPSVMGSGKPRPDWKFMEEFIKGLPYSAALLDIEKKDTFAGPSVVARAK